MYRNIVRTFILLLFFSCGSQQKLQQTKIEAKLSYSVDLTDRSDDLFHVNLSISGVNVDTVVFQMPATAPGTYQQSDFGRFIKEIKAFDSQGNEQEIIKSSVNQWKIPNTNKIAKIQYSIEDTWDTEIAELPIYRMGGTHMSETSVVVNAQGVFGYIHGYQSHPYEIKYTYPPNWTYGTSLKEMNGVIFAKTYDELVDSPVMFGELDKATVKVGSTDVDIIVFSPSKNAKAELLAEHLKVLLFATEKFVKGLPVERYVFLFHFEDQMVGALEHNLSSFYALSDIPVELGSEGTEGILNLIVDISAHEFFHVITPLNLHSEIIENYNFADPIPSQHLWLYEGATEWAEHIMQLRGGVKTLEQTFGTINQKLLLQDTFEPSMSLVQMAKNVYSDPVAGQQYQNIYYGGALRSMLLDIRLLELSQGQKGLMELILELTNKYGSEKPFSEVGLFDEIVEMTYPEIGDFIEKYIKGAEKLPMKEYMEKLGIDYAESKTTIVPKIAEARLNFVVDHLEFINVDQTDSMTQALGLQENDQIAAINGVKFDLSNPFAFQQAFQSIKPGDEFSLTVKRNEEELTLKGRAGQRETSIKHQLSLHENATPEQIALRNTWLKNL